MDSDLWIQIEIVFLEIRLVKRLHGLGTKLNLQICPFGNEIGELSFGKVVQKSIQLPASTRWGSPFRPPPWAQSLIPKVHGLGLIPQDIQRVRILTEAIVQGLAHHIGSVDRPAPRVAHVVLNKWHIRSTGVRMAGRLGIHEGGQGVWGKKDAGMDLSGGVKHWDKCKLRTALELVVFTSSRTARLELTKVLDAGKNWKWYSIWAWG